jgi:hypothetical protein
MVKLHLLVDGFEMFIFEKDTSPRMMTLKAGDIEDIVVEYKECLLSLLRVALDFFIIFEFEISLFGFG